LWTSLIAALSALRFKSGLLGGAALLALRLKPEEIAGFSR